MSRISENIRKITKAWGGKTTGNGISDALSDLYNNLPFGVKTEMVEIVPEQSVKGDNVEFMPNMYMASLMLSPTPMFIGGNKYTVMINDKTYQAIATEYSMEEESAFYIGASSPSFEDFPFRIDVTSNDDSLGLSWDKSLGETITLAIYEEQEVVKQIDVKYLPIEELKIALGIG